MVIQYNINEIGSVMVKSLKKIGLYFVKHKNEMHVPAAPQKL